MSYTEYFDGKDGKNKLNSSTLMKALMELNKKHPNAPIRIEFKDDAKVRKIVYMLEEDGILSIGIE